MQYLVICNMDKTKAGKQGMLGMGWVDFVLSGRVVREKSHMSKSLEDSEEVNIRRYLGEAQSRER